MASITFEGPSPVGGRVTTKIDIDDQAFLDVIEATCVSEGYTGDAPGLFVIQKLIRGWVHTTQLYKSKALHATADAQVNSEIAVLQSSLALSVDGQEFDLNSLAPVPPPAPPAPPEAPPETPPA